MHRALLTLIAGTLFAVSAAFGHDGAHQADERLAKGAQMLAARDAYAGHCAACHGADGTGAGAGTDFTSPEAVARLTRDDMIASARHKHPADAAAGWRQALGDVGLDGVIDYIRESLMLPAPVADASVGRKIYSRTCSVCHGERGNGASWARNGLDPPPLDFTSDEAAHMSRRRMIHVVTYGVGESAMMPFATQFTREEIAAVVDFIRVSFVPAAPAVAGQGEQHAAAAPRRAGAEHEHADHVTESDAPFPIGLVGNAAVGKIFFENNCSQCHGMKGDGDGPRAYFLRPKPKDFTSPRSRAELDRPHLFEGIANGERGTDMPAWSKVLTLQQIADVAEYVFQAFVNGQSVPSSAAGHGGMPDAGSTSEKKN